MMKKLTVLISILLMVNVLFAGGIKTNTNHSAAFIRTLNRNATLMVDAAYFNPAGLTKMSDGFSIGISNQSILQTRTVTNSFPLLNNDTYEGTTNAYLFPDVHLAYKMGKLAFSAAILPIGGGGSAVFDKGLPSFETSIAGLRATDFATDYTVDIEFEGSSLYFGMQAGAAYEINDMISVYVGVRYVTANNTYNGTITNLMVSQDGGLTFSRDLLSFEADTLDTSAAQATGAADLYRAAGDLVTAAYYDSLSLAATVGAATLRYATADKEVDVAQTGSGFAPIIGINLTPMEGLNIGIRYEMLTPLVMTNETTKDDVSMFPDGEETHQDMPAMLGLGIGYDVSDAISAQMSFNYYMNTGADWDDAEADTDDGYEAGLGIEYKLSHALVASVGFLTAKSGATAAYQSDLSYSLDSNTLGLGIGYSLNENTLINIGFANTIYTDGDNGTGNTLGDDTYAKTSMDFAIGVQFGF